MTNMGVITALVDKQDVVFMDRLCHASIVDAVKLSRAKLVVYQHCSSEDLTKKLECYRNQGRRALVITESVFSMDGDKAPLSELASAAQQYQAWLMVDEVSCFWLFWTNGCWSCPGNET